MRLDSGYLAQRQAAAKVRRLRRTALIGGIASRTRASIEDICCFRADNKYIAVVTAEGESLITTPLKELIERLDPVVFWQIDRGVIVNVNAIKSVRRVPAGHLELRLKQRSETLRVSAATAHLFKHM